MDLREGDIIILKDTDTGHLVITWNEDGEVSIESGTKGMIVKKYGNSKGLEVEWEYVFTLPHKDLDPVERPDYRTEIPDKIWYSLDIINYMKVRKINV